MNITELKASFLKYLQNNNLQQGSPYQVTWLEEQVRDFQNALQYAEHQIASVVHSITSGSENAIIPFIKEIHKRSAVESYRIAINAELGHTVRNERIGCIRQCESLSTKTIPVLNIENSHDLNFLRIGKMPRLLDGRLQRIGINPQGLSTAQKERAMQGQSAWLSSADVIQITAYIEAHLGKQESYYFLCAYYKENYLSIDRTSDPKAMMFAKYIKNEINQLGEVLRRSFSETTVLTHEEKIAYERVYVVYPSPSQIEEIFLTYANSFSHKLRYLSSENPEEMARFCVEIFNGYMCIHPFKDDNYRTISIVINALLSHFGYEFVDFHDNAIKRTLNIAFNCTASDERLAVAVLQNALIKKVASIASDASVKSSDHSMLFKQYKSDQIDQVIRRLAFSGEHEGLAVFLRKYPDMINVADQNPDKGFTPLHIALKNQHFNCVKLLLEAGAQYDITDKTGKTAIDVCLQKPNAEIRRLVLDHILGKYLTDDDKDINKALRVASDNGDIPALKFLLAHGADINGAGPKTGKTALHQATQKQHVAAVDFLIESGANPEITDNSGKKAIDYAKGNQALIDKLLSRAKSVLKTG